MENLPKKRHWCCYSVEYTAWVNMIQRCENPRQAYYLNYGARGIKVCEHWRDFRNFIADMGVKPTPRHTLDRIDNNGNYEPSNCQWATRSQQSQNRRNRKDSRYVQIGGVSKPLAVWAKQAGLLDDTVRYRLKAGWPVEKILIPADQSRSLNER